MADQEQGAESKVHDPTPQKLAKAREQGDIALSREVNSLASYLGLAAGLALFAPAAAWELAESLAPFLHSSADLFLLGRGYQGMVAEVVWLILWVTVGVLLAPALLTVFSLLAQRAFVFAPSKLKPKLSRISLLSNAKQKYGAAGMVEFLKSAAKLLLVTAVLWFSTVPHIEDFLGLARISTASLPGQLLSETLAVLLAVIAVGAVVAGADLAWQIFDYRRRNRMSRQELQDETKHTEGDPAMKSRRREKAQSLATNRMLRDVPKADVVITNPTHYAVALKWSRSSDKAPICLAKGKDEIAARIREAAQAAQVPIHSNPPLARSLHALVKVGKEIHVEHYRAVAAAIHFADKVRKARSGGQDDAS